MSKLALITGGSSGIGLATAQTLLLKNYEVIITGRDLKKLVDVKEALGARLHTVQSEASSLLDIEALMNYVERNFRKIDALVLNAASGSPKPFEQITPDEFDLMTNISYKGVFFTIQKALNLLSPGASFVAVTSMVNEKAAPGFSTYAAAKAAARSLVRTLSIELAPRNIRINAVSPGPVETPGLGRWDLPKSVVDAIKADLLKKMPTGRFVSAQEVAQCIEFLLSDKSQSITGAEFNIDGGVSNLF